MNEPLVSIVLPTYNGEKYIRESISSIVDLAYQNLELIIVNDCSSDDTVSIVNEYAKKDKRITVINNPKNYKLPKSLNIGFKRAKGTYYTWTSDDNYYLPNALQTMVDYLESHKDKIAVCANFKTIEEYNNKEKITIVQPNAKTLIFVGNGCGACFLYRAQVAKQIGQYNEDLFLIEDYDYWLRMGLMGEIGKIDTILYVYRKHADSLSSKFQQIQQKAFMLRQSYKGAYLERFPHLKQEKEYELSIIEDLLVELEHTNDESLILKKIKPHKIPKKDIYKLCKQAYKRTHNKIYIRAIKKLGMLYAAKAFLLLKKESKIKKSKQNQERLSADEWGGIYNTKMTQNIIDKIQRQDFLIQTKEILKIVQKGEKVLEIGSGTGESSVALSLAWAYATALDYSPQCLELTKSVALGLGAYVNLVECDALKPLPFKPLEFDVIFHAGLMEHFHKQDRIQMLSMWRPNCKKMVSMVPNASALAYRVGKAIQEKNGTWKYGLEIPIHSQVDEFIASGYRVVDEYSIGLKQALSFLDKKHPLRKAILQWIETNPCEDDCFQGYLLVTQGVNNVERF